MSTSHFSSAAPSACLACRQRHVKCDGDRPKCRRCAKSRLTCTYVASRRGQRTRVHGDSRSVSVESPPDPAPYQIEQYAECSVPDLGAIPTQDPQPSIIKNPAPSHSQPEIDQTNAIMPLSANVNQHLIDHYYSDFHGMHPILPNHDSIQWQKFPEHLQVTMQWIGSHYCFTQKTADLESSLGPIDTQTTPLHVASLLLRAIVLHGQNDRECAQSMLQQGVDLAIQLGMHRPGYALANCESSAPLAESLRRTWWELVVVDAVLAATYNTKLIIDDSTSFAELELPQSDSQTAEFGSSSSGLPTLHIFQARMFQSQNVEYSSLAFRLEAAISLRQVIQSFSLARVLPDEIQSLDNLLAGWRLHLPDEKVQTINEYGDFDAIIFQAHVFINWSVMLLHFPRSNLRRQISNLVDAPDCAKGHPNLVPASSPRLHAINALTASKAISDLLALRIPPERHLPMLICAVTLAAIVQIAAAQSHVATCKEQHRRRISLLLGYLRTAGKVFKLAAQAEGQIRPLAARLFCPEMITSPMPDPDLFAANIDLTDFMFSDLWNVGPG